MTKVVINPGACGFSVTVEIDKAGGKAFRLSMETECEMVRKLGQEMQELSMTDAFKGFLNNPAYQKAATCLRHVACPVPSGILKALEVEAGLNLPRDVSITFLNKGEDSDKCEE